MLLEPTVDNCTSFRHLRVAKLAESDETMYLTRTVHTGRKGDTAVYYHAARISEEHAFFTEYYANLGDLKTLVRTEWGAFI